MAWTPRMLFGEVKSRRCAQCWGPMVLKAFPVEDGQAGEREWHLICPKGCQPGGHVSEWFVNDQREHDLGNYVRVVDAYPELGPPPLTPEELKAAKEALWGKEDGDA